MDISVVTSAEELQRHHTDWQDLVDNAVEGNIFYEQWLLTPALRLLRRGAQVQVVLLWARHHGQRCLAAVFPLCRRRGYGHLPLSYLALWKHSHCFLCTPLVRSGCEAAAFAALWRWIDAKNCGLMLRLSDIRGDGLFYERLRESLQSEKRIVDQTGFERALLHTAKPCEAYIQGAFSKKSWSKYEKRYQTLARLGELRSRALSAADDPQPWIAALLRLESGGWKGRSGTALACHAEEQSFFEEIAAAAFNRGQLMMQMLTLDNRAIAVHCGLRSGDQAYALKIAYDEEYQKYSPGVQLEFEVIRNILSTPEIKWMDSCADPDQPALNRLLQERRRICHLNIASRRLTSRITVQAVSRLRAWSPKRPTPEGASQLEQQAAPRQASPAPQPPL